MLKSVKIGFPRRWCPLWLSHRQEPLTGEPIESPAVCGRLTLGSAFNFISQSVLSFPLAHLCFVTQIDPAMMPLLLAVFIAFVHVKVTVPPLNLPTAQFNPSILMSRAHL